MSDKKQKAKLLKSVNKRDVLTLVCEWHDCMTIYDDMSLFIAHVTEHLNEELISHGPKQEDASDAGAWPGPADLDHYNQCANKSEYRCLWRDCGHHEVLFGSFSELTRHTFFHAFHVKLKCVGVSLMMKNGLNLCGCNGSNRNMIPDFPEQFVCGWQYCNMPYDNPELFYCHVSLHCDSYPNGNFPAGGCRCYWDGCETVVKSKHRLKEHLRSHSQEKLMSCPTCGSLFSNATKFFDHVQRQTTGKAQSYQCSHCNKCYSSERLLRDHMRHHVYRYRCPFCDMTCPNPSSLRTHIHYRHTEERAYHCPSCEYSGKSAVDLRRHIETHERDWIDCTVTGCTYHARYFWEMSLHTRNVHQGLEPSKYLCHICNKKFYRGSRLTSHLKKLHRFKWPSGHTRFRYKQHEDGYYRLLAVRYESLEMTEQLLNVNSNIKSSGSIESQSEKIEAGN